MKKIILLSLGVLNCTLFYSQSNFQTKILKGYIILTCFDTSIQSHCDLNITTNEYGEIFRNDTVRCGDGVYYKNISTMFFVNEKDLDVGQIDDFNYQIKLQKYEHHLFLSTNPQILLQAKDADTSIYRNKELTDGINQNELSAETIYKQVQSVNKAYKKKRSYSVLLKVSIKVLQLPTRKKPVGYKSGIGYDQYILLYDKLNQITGVKVMYDPFR